MNLLAISTVSAVVSIWARPWWPKLHFSWAEIRSISGFGLNLSAFNIVNYFARNADNMLVGKYLGAAPLGYYALAYNIMLFPVQAVGLLLPLRRQGDEGVLELAVVNQPHAFHAAGGPGDGRIAGSEDSMPCGFELYFTTQGQPLILCLPDWQQQAAGVSKV